MIIDLNSLTKMIWLLYYRFFDYQQIILKDVECKLDGGISIKLYLQYYHVETVVDVLIDTHVNDVIVLDIKGDVQFGFIHLDFYQLIYDHIIENSYISKKDHGIIIKNEYLKDIHLCKDHIELELL